MSVQLVIAEKPSVARSIAAVIGADEKQNGYWQGGGYLVSWCIGHLVSFAEAGQYDEKYCKWKYEDLPILPQPWQFIVPDEKKQQFEIVRSLLNRPDSDYDALYQSALCRAKADWLVGIKMLREAARSDQPEDKLLLWLSRPSGTFCFRERDVLLKDTQAYNTWKFCGEQTHDRILAYAVELTGTANGTLQGNLYELDYQQHFQHIRDAALPVGANRLIYESGMREIGPKEHFDSRPDKYFGEFVRYEMQPRDPELLQAAIRQEQRSRESAQPGDFKEHLAALHTGLIEAEAQRIVADMKRLAAPNSPDKNHFIVEVSPYFTKLASSRDTDQLLAMLPYKSLHLSSVKDRFGIYALVDKNENRDKNIRKPRASVRKQLSETKQAASPKKAAARSKQHEMEV